MSMNRQKVRRMTYSTTVLGFYKNETMVMDLKQYLIETIHGDVLKQYICEKYQWEDNVWNMIDWRSIEITLASYAQY